MDQRRKNSLSSLPSPCRGGKLLTASYGTQELISTSSQQAQFSLKHLFENEETLAIISQKHISEIVNI